MKLELNNAISQDSSFGEERDIKRFEKVKNDKRIPRLTCIETENGQDNHFWEYDHQEDVACVEIHFLDSNGIVHLLTPDNSSFRGIKVYFISDRKILIAYELLEEERVHFCSWGYKKSSASTEKLFVYFKTGKSAYLAYVDAAFPERQFLLMDDDSGDYNPIRNLYHFLQEYLRKDCDAHEILPQK